MKNVPIDRDAHSTLLFIEQEWREFLAERRRVLEDAKLLKQMAGYYLHPEAPVAADGFATARCYFDRGSAPVDPDLVEGT